MALLYCSKKCLIAEFLNEVLDEHTWAYNFSHSKYYSCLFSFRVLGLSLVCTEQPPHLYNFSGVPQVASDQALLTEELGM